MRYLALACDYDGTIAHDGRVDDNTVEALKRARAAGRRLLLVTGRELDELREITDLELFDRVVAENGALLYRPREREEQTLAEPPPAAFVRRLAERGVAPLSLGRVIVATWTPHEATVLDTIREQGLELQVIFNKGAVMVLPAGVNKASGLAAALEELGLSPHNVVGVGDAENDHAFLAACGLGVAVANALPALKAHVDLVTEADHGAGVAELVERMVTTDLVDVPLTRDKHRVPLGEDESGQEVSLPADSANVLLAGASKAGKTTLASGLLERLIERGYQLCVLDPEGDYLTFTRATLLGEAGRAPTVNAVVDVLRQPQQNVVVNLLGVPLEDRPGFYATLLPQLQALRATLGRPHWIVVDEAHHLQPAWNTAIEALPQRLAGMLYITVDPGQLSQPVLTSIDQLLLVGEEADGALAAFCEGVSEPVPRLNGGLASGEAFLWDQATTAPPTRVRWLPPEGERHRHKRKYAEGELMPDRMFVFRGPNGKLNLRAHNLMMFIQLAEGVDEDTWLYHLRQGDYARWFAGAINDPELAEAAREAVNGPSADESRQRIVAAIRERYTAPQ